MESFVVIIDLMGWVGAAALLIAYGLVSTKRLDSADVPYHGINILGGVLLAINSGYYNAIPSVVVNVVWIGIGLVAVARRMWQGRTA
jgi:hypothetical protein